MAGKQIRILEKTTYDKIGQGLGNGLSSTIYVATNVDISNYVYGALVLRLHSWPTATGAPTLQIDGYGSAPTNEDPATTFRNTTTAIISGSSAKLTFSGSVAPAIAVSTAQLTTASPGFMDVALTLTQGTTSGAAIVLTVSIDLVLRS